MKLVSPIERMLFVYWIWGLGGCEGVNSKSKEAIGLEVFAD